MTHELALACMTAGERFVTLMPAKAQAVYATLAQDELDVIAITGIRRATGLTIETSLEGLTARQRELYFALEARFEEILTEAGFGLPETAA